MTISFPNLQHPAEINLCPPGVFLLDDFRSCIKISKRPRGNKNVSKKKGVSNDDILSKPSAPTGN
jgi:hypothetical protein